MTVITHHSHVSTIALHIACQPKLPNLKVRHMPRGHSKSRIGHRLIKNDTVFKRKEITPNFRDPLIVVTIIKTYKDDLTTIERKGINRWEFS